MSNARNKSKRDTESVAHYNAVLVEDLKSQFKLVIDEVKGVETRLDRKIDMRFNELSTRLDLHDQLLKENGKNWQENRMLWQENKKRWQENEKRWQENTVWQREAMRVLSQMDTRLERVENKLDHHEERITHLEDDVAILRTARSPQ